MRGCSLYAYYAGSKHLPFPVSAAMSLRRGCTNERGREQGRKRRQREIDELEIRKLWTLWRLLLSPHRCISQTLFPHQPSSLPPLGANKQCNTADFQIAEKVKIVIAYVIWGRDRDYIHGGTTRSNRTIVWIQVVIKNSSTSIRGVES